MKRKITALLLVLVMAMATFLTACEPEAAATLQSISVSRTPKVTYEVGEALDLTGGALTATYSDGTTKEVSLTDSAVTVQRPNMNTAGTKTVSVTYDSKSTTFKVTVSEAKLTVTFDLNYSGSAAQTVKVENGATVTAIADPERNDYVFTGWFIAADGNTRFNFEQTITADTTVYAHWGHTVEFSLNYQGSAASTVATYALDEKASAPATTPERNGFVFTGWYTDADCATAYEFGSALTANLILYAGWREVSADTNVYTVTFISNDGTDGKVEKKVVEGEKVETLTLTAPEGATAEFAGWYTNPELTNVFDFDTAIETNFTLYAKWDVSKYSVTFHYNHANNDGVFQIESIRANQPAYNPSARNATTGYYDTITLDGYYFGGWYKEAECKNEVDFNDRINAFTNYYAKWLKEWEFQAEYTDFGEREAFGYSANGTGASAFINKNGAALWGAHNGYWVANLHHQGLFVEFVIESNEAVDDAALVLRLSADFYDITLNKTNFEIKINDSVIDYGFEASITGAVAPDEGGIQNKRPFDNWDFGFKVSIKQGRNVIRFTMLDEVRYGEVGTMYATAPMIDSIYVNANSTLSWTPILTNV